MDNILEYLNNSLRDVKKNTFKAFDYESALQHKIIGRLIISHKLDFVDDSPGYAINSILLTGVIAGIEYISFYELYEDYYFFDYAHGAQICGVKK